MMRFLSVLTVVLWITTGEGSAQITLRGVVTDASTGEPLPAATLQVDGTYRGTVTNSEGAYTLNVGALPVTLIVRYIGYTTVRRTVGPGQTQQDFALTPTAYALDELVVTDEDPAVSIMRKVIERKRIWIAELETWQAEAYTRFTARNDTGIVAITESVSEAFWDRERGFREVAKGKRQTENLDFEELLPAAVFVRNLYSDDIEIAGYTFMGPTHPHALRQYDFSLDGYRTLDDQVVYDISVTPKNRLSTAFVGRVAVLDSAYALLEAELRPNASFLFPMPIQDFRITYSQQFSNFGRAFWLPVDFRSQGELEIGIPGLRFPTISIEQISRLTDYTVNVALPDSLYESDDLLQVDSAAVRADTAFSEQIVAVPLSRQEAAAYEAIDSTLTLEQAYAPTGPLARFAQINEGDDGGGASRTSRGWVPSFEAMSWYNRVDGAHWGLGTRWGTRRLSVSAEGGYATGTKDWTYGAGATARLGPNREVRLALSYRSGSDVRYSSPHYTRFLNGLFTALGEEDYFDYFRSTGWRYETRYRFVPNPVTVGARLRSEHHEPLATTQTETVFGRDHLHRFNPRVEAGRMRAMTLFLNYGDDFVPVTGNRRVRLELEHAPRALGGDYQFTQVRALLDWRIPTFFRRRLMPNTLDVRLVGGWSGGALPIQRFGTVDASLWGYSPFGVFKTLRGRPYEGERYGALFWEHSFRTVPFELLGLYGLARKGTGLSLHGALGTTLITRETLERLDYTTRTPEGLRHELGLSLYNLFGFPIRLDYTRRLDRRGYTFSFGLARMF